jgi:hypothetical protein
MKVEKSERMWEMEKHCIFVEFPEAETCLYFTLILV